MQHCGGTVLDCACGPGYGSYILSSVANVIGVDIAPEAIAHAEKHFPGPTYKLGDAREVTGGPYDWVVSFETIEHIAQPERAVAAFRKCAERLMISTPNEIVRPWYPWDHFKSDYPHLRHFSPKDFTELLEAGGWEVVARYTQAGKRNPVTRGNDGDVLIYICE
jgi:2-polyprenyl-3-methyl-5-hydroxy-6-metoxy-1,4-benzoquinol methylase